MVVTETPYSMEGIVEGKWEYQVEDNEVFQLKSFSFHPRTASVVNLCMYGPAKLTKEILFRFAHGEPVSYEFTTPVLLQQGKCLTIEVSNPTPANFAVRGTRIVSDSKPTEIMERGRKKK